MLPHLATRPSIHVPAYSSGTSHTLPCLQVPFHAWSPEVRHHKRRPFTPHHRVRVAVEESDRAQDSAAGGALGDAPSERSEAFCSCLVERATCGPKVHNPGKNF